MEFLQTLYGSWRSHVLQLLHEILELEHIQCYPKISTLPLSEECALAIHPNQSIALIYGIGIRVDAWPTTLHPLRCCSLHCCPCLCH